MQNILIVGINSYVGNSFEEWLSKKSEYNIAKVGAKNREWKEISFSKYDIVIHVAAIAHIKESKKNKHLYFEINRDLAIEVAEKSLREGVKQFIFLSSMSVYGLVEGTINKKTKELPNSFYGQSKLEAELKIKKLQNSHFKVAILRPPMIYGKNCKGNYQTLSKIAKKIRIFPQKCNHRSMIYIDNLSLFINAIIKHELSGIFFPQNLEYVNTSELVKAISDIYNHKIVFTKYFNLMISSSRLKYAKKIFGTLIYEKELTYNEKLKIEKNDFINFKESIIHTEKG